MQLTPDMMHPRRYPLTHELHARPFQPYDAPGRILFLAFKEPVNAAERDRDLDLAHLIAFIDRHGGPHPSANATHYTHDFGRFRLKWEQHTEFVTYMLYSPIAEEELFQHTLGALMEPDWVAAAPGKIISAIEIELLEADGPDGASELIETGLLKYFNIDGLAIAAVLDTGAIALSDFRIHEGGFTRFALVVHTPRGPRRIGRTVQRLIEIETYKTLALLALPIARDTSRRLNQIELELTDLVARVSEAEGNEAADILTSLSALSAEIETLSAFAAFRFGAGGAYEKIVRDRIEMLRESRVEGRQMFREFMLRRFEPAMETCHAAESRLEALSARASRIGELLRTRVDVEVQAQNQQLLRSMDTRAGLQLRLQRTVEGLSFVAISYYAVSLAAYLLTPLAAPLRVEKTTFIALIAVPIIVAIWLGARVVRKRFASKRESV
ncbi:MAG: DUF3422 domain-containing protein [Pseudomonadota bacterium]